MGKNDTKKALANVSTQQQQQQTRNSTFADSVIPYAAERATTNVDQNAKTFSGYEDLSKNPINQEYANRLKGVSSGNFAGSGGGGGSAVGTTALPEFGKYQDAKDIYNKDASGYFGAGRTAYQNLADTGGVDMAALEEALPGYRRMAEDGGINAEGVNRMRGLGGFDEFASTGGINAANRSNIRSRALSPIDSANRFATDELATRRNVQGGYAPGFDSAARAIKRDTSRNNAAAARDAELSIMDQVNAGRQWGIQGIAESEGAYQGLKTDNQLAGLGGIQTTNATAQGMRQQGKIAGAGGLLNTGNSESAHDQSRAAGLFGVGQQQNEDATKQFQMKEQQLAAAAAQGNIGAANELQRMRMEQDNMRMEQDNMQFLINADQGGRLAGLGGMNDVNARTSADYRGANADILNAQAVQNDSQGVYGGQRTNLATRPGVGTNIMNGIGMAAGIAAPFFTGGVSGITAGATRKPTQPGQWV